MCNSWRNLKYSNIQVMANLFVVPFFFLLMGCNEKELTTLRAENEVLKARVKVYPVVKTQNQKV
jgi:hypothetical protein